MSTEALVMALLEEGNPVTEIGDDAWSGMSASTYLAALQARSSEMTDIDTSQADGSATERPIPTSEPERSVPKRRWKPALVAAAVVILIGVIVALAGLLGGEEPVDFSDPQSVAEEFVSRFNAGDTASMMDMFTPDAVLALNGAGLDLSRARFEAWQAWDAGQKSQFVFAGCTREGTGHVCEASFLDAVADAAGWAPGTMQFTIELSPDGITHISQAFRMPDNVPLTGEDPFFQWMLANHRDDLRAISCCEDRDSDEQEATIPVEDARAAGELRRRYADEWGAFLADTGCDARDVDCQRENY